MSAAPPPILVLPGERPDLLGPMRRWRGLTWIGWLNVLVLRWLLVRLCYRVEPNNTISRYWLRGPMWPWERGWRRIGEPMKPDPGRVA